MHDRLPLNRKEDSGSAGLAPMFLLKLLLVLTIRIILFLVPIYSSFMVSNILP